jgi:hypothetical protein
MGDQVDASIESRLMGLIERARLACETAETQRLVLVRRGDDPVAWVAKRVAAQAERGLCWGQDAVDRALDRLKRAREVDALCAVAALEALASAHLDIARGHALAACAAKAQRDPERTAEHGRHQRAALRLAREARRRALSSEMQERRRL